MTDKPIDPLLDGPGEEDGPWAEGWESRRAPDAPIVIPVDKLEDFWKEVYPNGMTVENVNNELSDLLMVLHDLPKLFMHVTGGKVSKPNTDKSVVMSLHDDHITELVRWEVDEALEIVADEFEIDIDDLKDVVHG